MAEYILTDQDFNVILKLFADATSINIADAGSYFDGTEVETALQEIGLRSSVARPLNGFEDKTNSTLSWVGSTTRTLTLTPTGTDYYWLGGARYSYDTPLTCQIADTSGIHWIYFDAATPTVLSSATGLDENEVDTLILDDCLVAIVYWNATDDVAYILADERHGCRMSAETHHYLHDTQGARFVAGGGISEYTLDTATDAAISFDLQDCTFYDEDLEVEISDGVATNQYEQVLTGDAEIPVLYKDDVDGSWKEQAASTLPYIINGTPQPTYNKDDGDGTWSQAELSNNKYMLYHLVCTNDWQYPIKMIQGSNEYATQADARTAINTEISNWSGLPTPEFTLMYAFVMQQSAGNTKELVIKEILDYRFQRNVGIAAQAALEHGKLVGLLDDDHTQYLLVAGTRALTGNWDIGDGLYIATDEIRARDAAGLSLQPSGGSTGIYIVDDYRVVIGETTGANSGVLVVKRVQDAATSVRVQNESTGTAARSEFICEQQANNFFMIMTGTNYPAPYDAKGVLLTGAGVKLMLEATSGPRVVLDNTGGVFITKGTDFTNAKMTIGLTIDQGANDDEILAFKSSDVAHGMTDIAETDTYVTFQKTAATTGGLNIRSFGESNTSVHIAGYVTTEDTTFGSTATGPIVFQGSKKSAATVTSLNTNASLMCIRNHGTTYWQVMGDGKVWQNRGLFINDNDNTFMTTGITVNQGATDDEILAFKSSDVNHGITAVAETDTFASFKKIAAATGGNRILGIGETTYGVWIDGHYTTDDTTKSSSGVAPIILNTYKSNGAPGADANIVAIRKAGTSTVWIVDEDGDTWQTGYVYAGPGVDVSVAYHRLYNSTAGETLEVRNTSAGACWLYVTADADSDALVWFAGDRDNDGSGTLWAGMGLDYSAASLRMFYGGSAADHLVVQANALVFINDNANAGMTTGLTINQGEYDDEIFALKSSDVAHGCTDFAETDTYCHFLKAAALTGGWLVRAYTEASTAIYLAGVHTTDYTTHGDASVGTIILDAYKISGTGLVDPGAGAIVLAVQGGGDTKFAVDQSGHIWLGGKILINDTANAFQSYGLTVQEGTTNNEAISLKSTYIAHGLTSYTETDTYAVMWRRSSSSGGLVLRAYCEDAAINDVLFLQAWGGTADTTKTTAGIGLINLFVTEHNGSNTLADITADGNVFTIRARVGSTTRTVWIIDEDGDFYYDGGVGGAFDSYEDAHLARALTLATSSDFIKSQFDEAVRYNERSLVEAGILGAPIAEGGLINGAQLQRLHNGAIWQLYEMIKIQESQILELTSKLKLLEG